MRLANNVALRRQEIRRFLMARRATIAPDAVGLPGGSRRRTPGLRREEVASLAGIGVTWYTWFEQGRDIRVSARLLERIAHALRLTPSDTEYLFSLSGVPRSEPALAGTAVVDRCSQDILDGFQSGPALLVSPCWDVLAYNRLADLIFEFDHGDGPFARNHLWRFFMDPQRRAKYLNWETLGQLSVQWMRAVHGKMLDDAYFNSLLRSLCEGSKEFRRLWEAQVTSPLEDVKLEMKLPRFGSLCFTSVRFRSLHSPHVLVLASPADQRTVDVMRELLTGKPARKKTTPSRSAAAGGRLNR
jgi:transcriptional regulator with XRE-family HTH domain